jgi:type I restriction enzyme, S subunit
MNDRPFQLGSILLVPPEYGANAAALPPDGQRPRYLRITDIDDDGRLLNDDIRSIPESVATPYLLEHQDIVIARTGNTVGKSYLHDSANGPLAFAGYLVRFRIDPKRADPAFVFQFLHSPGYRSWVGRTIRTGAQPNINASEYKRLDLPSFGLTVQRRIAEILSTLDETIEQTEALIAKYAQIRVGLMHDLFTRGLTPDGRLRPTAAQAPHLYKESPVGWIPREWKATSVGDCLTGIDAGKSPDCPDTPASGTQCGVLKVGAVDPEGLRENENKVVLDKRLHNAAFLVRRDDLLLSRANTFDLVGLVCHVDGDPHNLMLSDKTLRLASNSSKMTTRFLFWSLQTALSRRQIQNVATGTSGSMKNITQAGVRAIRLTLPDVSEQLRITHRLDAVVETIGALKADCTKFRRTKYGLMQDLLTGRVLTQAVES